jgi:hypothetical protein
LNRPYCLAATSAETVGRYGYALLTRRCCRSDQLTYEENLRNGPTHGIYDGNIRPDLPTSEGASNPLRWSGYRMMVAQAGEEHLIRVRSSELSRGSVYRIDRSNTLTRRSASSRSLREP